MSFSFEDQSQNNNQSLSTFDTEQKNWTQYQKQEKQLSHIEEIFDSDLEQDSNQSDAIQGDYVQNDDEDKKLQKQEENKKKGGKKKFKLSKKTQKLIQKTYKKLTKLGNLEKLYSSSTQINNHRYLQDHPSKINQNLYEALQGISQKRKFIIKKKWNDDDRQKKGSFNNCTYRIKDEFICKFRNIFDKLNQSD
ncbi:hypothetical protein PPERSA_11180 [Pseudocohnilembus persalinus]|uniref:Uncharacterized protein n=1 Tax=Pseudocohnilembus persalinus TaxID=266149 RepID=A0A0V0QZ81_PSEPJ|nr:hypothetical protein PPERSA_11180 [Pseudocohnilembus persalinus]|eukprot:KRX07631.1 hypothetical protein PPERSA_11180 [Pseudocohnilembus persalinus]